MNVNMKRVLTVNMVEIFKLKGQVIREAFFYNLSFTKCNGV